MQEEKIKKYLIFTLLFQIIILFVGIIPTSSISIGDKLEFVILTNIGLLSGTSAQIYLINKFLDGQFLSYGYDCWNYTEGEHPMDIVFPTTTSCRFNYHGGTGQRQRIVSMCVLPMNVVNQRIYMILWFWLIFLSIISGLTVLYRLAMFSQRWIRSKLMHLRMGKKKSQYHSVRALSYECGLGEWFLLYLLCNNINTLIFEEIIQDLQEKLRERRIGRENCYFEEMKERQSAKDYKFLEHKN